MNHVDVMKIALNGAGIPVEDETARCVLDSLHDAGFRLELVFPCRCGCGRPKDQHLCPCGCEHPYADAVAKAMGGPMYLSWEQAEAVVDDNPHIPCKW